MSSKFTAVVIDTDDGSRSSLITQLRSMPGVSVEKDAGDLQLGMKLARQVRPSLLVIEAKPLDEALAAAERFHLEFPATSIFILSTDTQPNTILRAMRAGAKEFMPRPVPPADFAEAVDRLLKQADRSSGGRGKIFWTLCGVLFLKLIDNSLNLLDLSHFAIMMVKGGVILAAALLDALRHRAKAAA